ncbi:transporter substrate-binding domain-containing protein [Roseobacter ponti]|uniref:histidine kinase n=1 Tax=Roseobacter ponti TaxID=1891787 RepID=A0A858SRI0_9RHOB|nr:transporter substrate-binding domain-containing protein [Roseobacter ponti]QJF50597.1 transporter substrate-binding domain-containing protein [Roseobacter ponti]
MPFPTLRQVTFAICAAFAGLSAQAEAVFVGWAPVPSLYEETGTDTPDGFFGNLATRIADRAGLDIEFVRYATMWDAISAQANGEVQMLAGVTRLGILSATNIYSEPVAQSAHYLVVRTEDRAGFDLDDGGVKRIGVIESRRMTFTARDKLAGHHIIPHESGPDGLHALLAGLTDALVVIGDPFFHNLRLKRIDHRVASVNGPLQTFDRAVALHGSRAELMPLINAALSDLNASGELEFLRQQWGLVPTSGAPDLLTVGVTHFPPFQVIRENGTLTGFSVEALRALGERAGLSLRFVPITSDAFGAGPRAGTYDILPQAGVTPERARRMDFALPTSEYTLSAFVRADDVFRPQSLEDLAGERVGAVEVNIARRRLEATEGIDLVIFSDVPGMMGALAAGEIRAAVNIASVLRTAAREGGLEGVTQEVRPPLFSGQRAPALRFGLGDVRERLNVVIPGYLASDEYRDLQLEWFGPKPLISDQRISQIAIATLAGLLVLGAYAALQHRARLLHQRDAAQNQRLVEIEMAHTRKAKELVAQLEITNADLARSNSELDAFAYIASHDLKAPLLAIEQTSQWIEEDLGPVLTDESRESFDLLRNRVSRMSMLLHDLLEHARIDRNETGLRLVSGRQLATEVIDLAAVPESFTVILDQSLDSVHVNATPLLTVLLNLVRNSVKHAEKPCGTIRLSVREKGEAHLFCVEDDGPGIDPRYHERIFGMFQTLRPRDEVEGSGMGLAIVQKTVTLAGGRISLESSPGNGCRFFVEWPKPPVQTHTGNQQAA